jgi:glycosyltransferase involved in cell wall biosynthesis
VEEASLIVFNTLAEMEKAGHCGWHLQACITVPHVVDLSGWRNLPPRSTFEGVFPQLRGRDVILFVGRINWVKNLGTLLDALAIVRRDLPGAVLVCVGPSDDGYRAELERKAQIMGLQDALLFTGMLVGRALKTAYARGDVLALVSKKENFGLAVAEGLAAGLPVVVSTGVDLAAGWASEGPVRRVEPAAASIAGAIEELLDRSHSHGLPDREAQALAERELGGTRIHSLIESYHSVVNA